MVIDARPRQNGISRKILACQICNYRFVVDDANLILRNTKAGSAAKFFHRTLKVYQQGFGSPDSLYWIGLDRLHNLSQSGCGVRFNLQDLDGTWYYAQYSTFVVNNAANSYRLSVGGFSGDIYDSMSNYQNNMPFSTYDHDNYCTCGRDKYFGWWHNCCCAACIALFPTPLWYTQSVPPFGSSNINLNATEVRFACWWTMNINQ